MSQVRSLYTKGSVTNLFSANIENRPFTNGFAPILDVVHCSHVFFVDVLMVTPGFELTFVHSCSSNSQHVKSNP